MCFAATVLSLAAAAPVSAQLRAEQGRTDQQRRQALQNFQLARGAVDRYLSEVSQDPALAAHGLHPLAIKVMDEIGIDLRDQRSKDSREYLGHKYFGYVIIVSPEAEANSPHTFLNAGQRLYWPFEDLAHLQGTEAQKLDRFRHVRDQLDRRIRDWLAELPAGTKRYVHINNTNPILDESSDERRTLDAAGIEVAWDGMEIAL